MPYLEAFPGYVQSVPNRSRPLAWSTPFAPVDPVCRPTSHGAGELPSSTVTWFRCHPRWGIHKFQPVLLTAYSRFHLGKSVEHVWDEMECWFTICISSLPKPINLQQFSRDLMQVWIVILHDFHASAIWSMRRIWSAVINTQRGHICCWLYNFTSDKCVFHNLWEHKDCFFVNFNSG